MVFLLSCGNFESLNCLGFYVKNFEINEVLLEVYDGECVEIIWICLGEYMIILKLIFDSNLWFVNMRLEYWYIYYKIFVWKLKRFIKIEK